MGKKRGRSKQKRDLYLGGGELGKLIGTGAGAIGGSFIGQPMLGAKVGGMAGGAIGGAVDNSSEEQSQPVNYAGSSYGYAQGGALNFLGQNAFAFTGPSHENGGIPIAGNAEVEGGETMDFIEFRDGGMIDTRDGSPYIFSKRLKLPDSSATFADKHKELVNQNANEDEIKKLAHLQERVSGRADTTETDIPSPTTSQHQENREKQDIALQERLKRMKQGDYSMVGEPMQADTVETKENGGKIEYQQGGPPFMSPPNWYVDPKGTARGWMNTGRKMLGKGAQQGQKMLGSSKLPQKGLNTITTKSLGRRLLGPLGIGIPAGIAAGEAYTGKDLTDEFGKMRENQKARNQATQRAQQAQEDAENTKAYYSVFPEGAMGESTMPFDFNQQQESQGQFGPEDLIVEDAPNEAGDGGETYSPNLNSGTNGGGSVGATNEASPEATAEPTVSAVGADEVSTPAGGATGEEGVTAPAMDLGADAMASGAGASEEGGGMGWSDALQFVPEIMNFATGALGGGEAEPATKVGDQSVKNMPTRYNVNPILQRNAQSYRAILADPNASMNQKLAAQAQKQQADSQAYAKKFNEENRMKTSKARVQSSIDRQNAQYRNQRRTEQQQIDAQFGPTGNMARNAIGSASQKLLMKQAQNAQKDRDKMGAAAIISQLDPALQEKYINQLGLFE